jgi:hypothetical protein
MGYMNWFPVSYGRCTFYSSIQGCLNYDTSLDCVEFVNNYNSLVARKNLAPQNAEEPIQTAATIYTAAVQGLIDLLAPQVVICQEAINSGAPVINSRDFGDTMIGQQVEFINQMEQVLNILRQVEEQSGNE